MGQRMAQRTKDLQISGFIIISVLILMMYPKDLRNFIIATNFTFFKKSAYNHLFADSCKFRLKGNLCFFVNALFRTIDSFSARTIIEFFSTMSTFIVCQSFSNLRSMIAKSRTIFCFPFSKSNIEKSIATDRAITIKSFHLILGLARTRAIPSDCQAVRFYFNDLFTNKTIYGVHLCH